LRGHEKGRDAGPHKLVYSSDAEQIQNNMSSNPADRPSATKQKYALISIVLAAAVAGLYVLSRHNYPLFHSFADGITVLIATGVFVLVWSRRRLLDNQYYLFVGIAFLFFAFWDFLHLLGNKDMGVFPQYGNMGPTLYIVSRYFLAVSMLAAPLFIRRRLNVGVTFAFYSVATVLLVLSIFYWQNFPVTYIEGVGLTPFKVISDYVICGILLVSLVLLALNRRALDARVFRLVTYSFILFIATGLVFTTYTDPFGVTNALGHFFQIASFYLVYAAFLETVVVRPQDILYRNVKESEEKYRNLFSNMAEEVHFWKLERDQSGKIKTWRLVDANPPTLRTWGRQSVEEIRGKTADEILGPGSTRHYMPVVQKVMTEGVSYSYEDYFANLDKYFRFTTVPFGDYFITTGTDITGIKQAAQALKESEEQFRRAIQEAPIPVIMQAEDGQVLQVSRSWTELTGYTSEDMPTFEAWLDRAYGEGADEVRRHVRSLFDGNKRSIDIELPIRTIKGDSRYWSFSASSPGALADGRRFIVGMAVDITERKKTEQIKDEFIGMVSHELRTPLTVVIGALGTAIDKRVSQEDKEELLKDASSGAESLAAILDNMLELSRYQAGRLKLDRKAIPITDIAGKATQRVRRKYDTHDIVLDIPEGIPKVNVDAVRIEQVLYNLVENAVKYSPSGSRVRVFGRRDENGTVIGVSDAGVGISSEDQKKLFEPFTRLERSGGAGVGLGLVVCKRLVEAHGGRLWIESQPGRGSTFLFTIPSAKVSE
jgi:PAS domain S-box-containing protein